MSNAQDNSMKSTEIIASIGFFVISAYLVSSITIRHFSHSTEQLWAKKETDRLSTQIAYLTEAASVAKNSSSKKQARLTRYPAATLGGSESSKKTTNNVAVSVWKDEGTLGNDPWGKPYRYKVFRDESGEAKKVAVWSEGENSHNETDFSEAITVTQNPLSVFLGDDAGFIRALDTLDKL
ncbi:MAG: hypothetical protein SGJ18_06140 [Pseudomonadota bacterium]|mgnify:CR=1 FL=1|nr:hypothetical protein [Pseudomonadota bacterium]